MIKRRDFTRCSAARRPRGRLRRVGSRPKVRAPRATRVAFFPARMRRFYLDSIRTPSSLPRAAS
jgi:hypothetical protein